MSQRNPARKSTELADEATRVVLTADATSANCGYYHLTRNGETGSLCGLVSENQFSGSVSQILSKSEAERLGHQLCGHCASRYGE